MPVVVVYDANVLYPSTLRDVLIRVGLARLARPKWTDRILDEVFGNLRANRPDLDSARLDRTRRLMNDAIRDVTVTGYERLIDQLDLPDPDDRHVLAAAIHAESQVIVTRNLRDFPADRLAPWGVEAQHPDDFLTGLHQDHPDALGGIAAAIARTWATTRSPAMSSTAWPSTRPSPPLSYARHSGIADRTRFARVSIPSHNAMVLTAPSSRDHLPPAGRRLRQASCQGWTSAYS
ncbi:PIN domain-containing protein [Luethyella okanaganae]|uniref:PIN domain-containing protein n=1 Tax=Luethyella okanaganae TaxID=69372 RepID=A0ABW1VD08_9MICO